MSTPRFALLFLTLCVLFLSTCSDDNPGSPSDGVMKIYGTVSTPEGPLGNATTSLEGYENSLLVSIQTNEAGEYAMTVPEGRYRLILRPPGSRPMFYARGGPTYRGDDAEEIVVSDSRPDLRADFRLGRVELTLQVPSGMQSLEWGCGMTDATTGYTVDNGLRTWRDGSIEFVFSAVVPGRYCFRVGSLGSHFWYPNAMSVADARAIEVGALEKISLSDSLAAPGHVTGTLVGAWALIADPPPEIQLYGPDSTVTSRSSCGEDGRFDVPVIVDGVVRLKVEAGDQEIWLGGRELGDADPLTVTSGSIVEAGAIQTHGLTCRMIGAPGWERDEWKAILTNGEHGVTIIASKGDAEGEWIVPLSGPATGGLRVQWLNPSEWRPQWYDRKASLVDADFLYVNDASGPTSIDVQLERGGTISGRVRPSDGSPLQRYPIVVRLPGGLYGGWLTESDGSFRIAGLPDGPIPLAVHHPTGLIWYPGTLDESQAEPIEIVDAGDRTGLEFVLATPGE